MNHVYAKQGINSIVTGSDTVRDLVMITLGDGKIRGERTAVSLFSSVEGLTLRWLRFLLNSPDRMTTA